MWSEHGLSIKLVMVATVVYFYCENLFFWYLYKPPDLVVLKNNVWTRDNDLTGWTVDSFCGHGRVQCIITERVKVFFWKEIQSSLYSVQIMYIIYYKPIDLYCMRTYYQFKFAWTACKIALIPSHTWSNEKSIVCKESHSA